MKTIFMLFISAVFVVYSIYQFMNRLEAKKNIVKQLLFIVLGMDTYSYDINRHR